MKYCDNLPKYAMETQSEQLLLKKCSWQTCLTQGCHQPSIYKKLQCLWNAIKQGMPVTAEWKLIILQQSKCLLVCYNSEGVTWNLFWHQRGKIQRDSNTGMDSLKKNQRKHLRFLGFGNHLNYLCAFFAWAIEYDYLN